MIQTLSGLALAVSSLLVPGPAPQAGSTADTIGLRLAEAYEAGRLHGAALVLDGDEEVAAAVFGTSATGAPLSLDARFRIASLTKLFTQAAILRLRDQGRIDLDAPLRRYRPDTRVPEEVTIRRLLTMRSGLPRELTDDSATSGVSFDAAGRAGPFLDALQLELAFEPGTDQAYSNVAYWMLGAALEAITDRTYAEALDALVIGPLGLTGTGFGRDELGADGHVTGYELDASGELVPAEVHPIRQRYASGGMFSTPRDLARFCRSFGGDALLSAEGRALLMTGFDPDRAGAGPLVLRGSGHVPGFAHYLTYEPGRGRGVLLLNNRSFGSAALLRELEQELQAALGDALEAEAPGPRVIEVRSAKDGLPDTPLGRSSTRWLAAVASEDADEIHRTRVELLPAGKKDSKTLREVCEQLAGLSAELRGFETIGYQERKNGDLFVVVRGTRAEARFTFRPGTGEGAVGSIADIEIDIVPRGR